MNYLFAEREGRIQKLALADIFYIRSHPDKPHCLIVATAEGSYELHVSLRQLEEEQPDYLTRCHRNSLVNLAKVTGAVRETRTLCFGKEGIEDVTCSRRYFSTLVKRWMAEGGR